MTKQYSPQEVQKILKDRADILARQVTEKKEQDNLEVATFHLDDERFGVITSFVYETQPLRSHHWTKVPSTPAFIVGVINIRGHIYSIMDLACFAGLPPRPISGNAHVLLIKGQSNLIGKTMELSLLTDDIPKITHIPYDHITTSSISISSRMQEYVYGVTPNMIKVIDLKKLLSDPQIIIRDEV